MVELKGTIVSVTGEGKHMIEKYRLGIAHVGGSKMVADINIEEAKLLKEDLEEFLKDREGCDE